MAEKAVKPPKRHPMDTQYVRHSNNGQPIKPAPKSTKSKGEKAGKE